MELDGGRVVDGLGHRIPVESPPLDFDDDPPALGVDGVDSPERAGGREDLF